jgi:vacuolar-type H+-ATPase subunit E/Vma4
VPYGDLLVALEAEVREQRLAIEGEARAEAERIAEEGRRLSAATRAEALTRAGEQADAILEEARRRATVRVDRAELLARDRALAGVREAAGERLPSGSTPALTLALLAESLADDDGSPLVVTCDPGHAPACREWLERERPDAAGRTTVVEAPAARGGVELAVGRSLVVDDTLPSRLESAWPGLSVELGRILFGGLDG